MAGSVPPLAVPEGPATSSPVPVISEAFGTTFKLLDSTSLTGAPAPLGLPFTPPTPLPLPAPCPAAPSGPTEAGSGGSSSHDGGFSVGGFIGEGVDRWRLLDLTGRLAVGADRLVTRPVTITVPPG